VQVFTVFILILSKENDADENVAETTSNLSETLNDAEGRLRYLRKTGVGNRPKTWITHRVAQY
jgi:glucose-6-phosphate isomerase